MNRFAFFTIIILIINFSQQRFVTVVEVSLQCQREVTSRIICTLTKDTGSDGILEIINVFSYIRREMTDAEVRDATELNLSSRFMSDFMPFGIGEQFRKLEALWVVKSQLKFIEKGNFAEMQQLKALNLYENQIADIQSDTLENLPELRYLDIDTNEISDLHADLLAHQSDLLVFRASYNQISSIPDGFFRNTAKIEEIYLKNNKIVEVNVDFLRFVDLTVVDLEGNENGCDFSTGYLEIEWNGDGNNDTITVFEKMIQLQYKVEKFCRLKSLKVEN